MNADSLETIIAEMRASYSVTARDFANRLAALPRAEWRDISTAPKVGPFLACNAAGGRFFASWDGSCFIDNHGLTRDPMYWQPLPPPPEKEST